MCLSTCRQDGGRFFTLAVLSFPLGEFMQWVTCLSILKWHRKEINSAHLQGKPEMGCTLNHSSWHGMTGYLSSNSRILKANKQTKNLQPLPVQQGHICQIHLLMSDLGGDLNLPSQRAASDWQRQRRQTERQTQTGRGTCRYANAAAAMRRHGDTTLPTQLSTLGGQPADFSHLHRQPSFSTLLETGHCHLLLSFRAAEPISAREIERCAFYYEWNYSGLRWVTPEDLLLVNESPNSSPSILHIASLQS